MSLSRGHRRQRDDQPNLSQSLMAYKSADTRHSWSPGSRIGGLGLAGWMWISRFGRSSPPGSDSTTT